MSLRCLACWGRVRYDFLRDWYTCDSCSRLITGQANHRWRHRCRRDPGRVISC